MKPLLLFLLSMEMCTACSKKNMDIQFTNAPATDTVKTGNAGASYQYLALGDSYTVGQSVDPALSFPYQLKSKLGLLGYNVQNPNIIAVTGWTTGDLINGITQANLTGKYDFVTLLIGVNNQYRGYSLASYQTEFVQLLNSAIVFANGKPSRVFVLSIPDWGVTPYANGYDRATIATQIDQFNSVNKDESIKAGVNYVDITGISRLASSDPTLIATDGLHPSAKMYALWVNQLAPVVMKQFK